jgi:hypothetical protein
MKTNGYVYLRINKNYTATIRDLKSFSEYLDKVGDTDHVFGEVTAVSNVHKTFLNAMYKIVNMHKNRLNKRLIGRETLVVRNQGSRDARVVGANSEHLLIEYEMPNGTTALNIIDGMASADDYKSITYKNAMKKFDIELSLLINNPQKKINKC